MAKYHDMGIADVAFTAGADLTARQYHFVIPGSVAGEVILATGASNPTPFGILQNSPSSGQEARVRVLGMSKVVGENGTCTLKYGAFGFSASDGQFEVVTVATSPANARWVGAAYATAGSIYGEVLLLGGFSACLLAAS